MLLDLAHDERGAPAHVGLGDVDVGEDVVAHIHDVVAATIAGQSL